MSSPTMGSAGGWLTGRPSSHSRGPARGGPHTTMCSKVAYESYTEARAQARYLTKIGHKQNHPYQCDHCGLWHLTTMSRKAAKKVMKARRKRARYESA